MSNKKTEASHKIIDATIALIKEEQDVKDITIRGIAKRAGIAKSMINYYFRSKDNLIDEAVQSYVSSIISANDAYLESQNLTAVARLKRGAIRAASFLAENPGVARLSVLRDLKYGSQGDNTSQSCNAIFLGLKDIYQDQCTDVELRIKAQQLVATLQAVFLRAAVFKQHTGIDFYNKEQRKQLVESIVNNIVSDF